MACKSEIEFGKWLIVLLVLQGVTRPITGECRHREDITFTTAAISNGRETGYLRWQSVVMIRANGIPLCTGTLIHPNVVITAGHCVEMKHGDREYAYEYANDPGVLQVAGGPEGNEALSSVADILVHPLWDGDIGNKDADLALMLLENDVTQYPSIAIREKPLPQVGDDAVIVGFGADPTIGSTALEDANRHREGQTTIRYVTPYYFEIGGDSNTCNGDSGGPLLTYQDFEWRLAGIVSFGSNACVTQSQGYAVNLTSYCGWLNDAFTRLTGEDLGMRTCSRCNEDLDADEDEVENCIAEEMRDGESSPSCAFGKKSTHKERSILALIKALL